MKKSLYFDLTCGAAGDMILASLISVGVPVEYLREQFKRIAISNLTIGTETVKRHGIEALRLVLSWEKQDQYRNIDKIMGIIESGNYSDQVINKCSMVLKHLAEAEAKVHGVSVDRVHFHEIGAVDTIIDLLGVVLGLEYLGVDEIFFSQLTVGQGTIVTEHGTMPVPVPATAEMLKGLSVRTLQIEDEILTPTGCALLTSLGTQNLSGLNGTVLKGGYGCGSKEFSGHPNVLRVFLLQENSSSDVEEVCQVETEMDHIGGEIMGHISELLRKEGVLDLCWIPVYMKKGRPGYRLSFLCNRKDLERLVDSVIIHSRTLGVRWQKLNRICAERENGEIIICGVGAKEKHCRYKKHAFSKLEYESLAQISDSSGVPILDIIEDYNRNRC